jgi:hypothetical protein
MNIDIILIIILCVVLFIIFYCICLRYKIRLNSDRFKKTTHRLMRRNIVSPTIELDIETKDEKENDIRFSQIV